MCGSVSPPKPKPKPKAENGNIVIDEDDIPQTGKHLYIELVALKSKADDIRNKVCSVIGKTDINSVTSMDLKNSNVFKKQLIADDLLSLLNLCDVACKSENVNFVSDSSKNVLIESTKMNQFCQNIATNCRTFITKQDEFENNINNKLDKLSDFIVSTTTTQNCPANSLPNLAGSGYTAPKAPDVSKPSFNNPTKCFESCEENFIGGGLSQQITSYLDNCEQFKYNVENGHSVISFGEPYHYTGSKSSQEKTDIPEPFITLIKAIKPEHPNSNINSVLINKYSGPGSSLPPHSDNELSIEPGSLIFSVSLGQSCKISYNEIHGDRKEELVVNGNSLYTMTQASQWFWTHKIDAESTSHFSEDDVRYSITLRSVHSRFHNSTVIVGDSNTKHLKFGEGMGSFGYYYPGKRIQAPLINDINVTACAGYSNIILHCGINDIKSNSINNIEKVSGCFEKLRHKIELVRKLCPTSQLIVSPILPTKDKELSAKAFDFNEMLFCFEDNVQQFRTLNFNCFCDMNGILLNSMGCYNKPSDILHLGSQGIKQLVKLIKDCVRVRKVRQGRSYASITKGVTVSPTSTNTSSTVS